MLKVVEKVAGFVIVAILVACLLLAFFFACTNRIEAMLQMMALMIALLIGWAPGAVWGYAVARNSEPSAEETDDK